MMKVMTFNIQHALDFKRKIIDIGLFVRAIAHCNIDVCCMNEVRGEGPLEGYTDQAGAIGDGLGFHHYFAEAIKVRDSSPYGNAIISRTPFKSVETIPIPDPADRTEGKHYETRCIARSIIQINDRDICIMTCHMGLNLSERINAVNTLCYLIDETDLPIILTGDFNTLPDSNELQPLFERLNDTDALAACPCAPTFPSDAPRIKIDYLLYRGLECISVETVPDIVSDHLAIIAEFK